MIANSIASSWADTESSLALYILGRNASCLGSYRANPDLIEEHCNHEREVAQGGYSQRQIYELIQNGADALQGRSDGRIEVVLTSQALYCANEGEPITEEGAKTILMAYLSTKRGNEIGRFGLGFKAVLNVCLAPEFYSRSGSFRFSGLRSLEWVREVAPQVHQAPTLRLAEPIDPQAESEGDATLRSLMDWATTVVKLPLRRGHDWLANDLQNFPAEFLLFSPHVARLTLTDRRGVDETWSPSQVQLKQRHISAQIIKKDAEFSHIAIEETTTGGDSKVSQWKVFSGICKASPLAREDGGVINDREELPVSWAVPLSTRQERSKFWAFFPTEEFITLSGILNAPWKTNSDRQNVLSGPLNAELLEKTTQLILGALPHLQNPDDPARYLEYLPALNDNPCWGDIQLRDRVYTNLAQWPCLLDAEGTLRRPADLLWHPRLPREALAIWHAYPGRPAGWMHPSNELQHRRARLEHLMKVAKPACSVEEWLEALVKDRTALASAYALRAAAALLQKEPSHRKAIENAQILLSSNGSWIAPKPGTVFVALDGAKTPGVQTVDPRLLAIDGVASALDDLGIRGVDATSLLESLLKELVEIAGDTSEYRRSRLGFFDWKQFWLATRAVPLEAAQNMIRGAVKFPNEVLHARNEADVWLPLDELLLPGELFAARSGEPGALINLEWHGLDEAILRVFGGTDAPRPGYQYEQNFYSKRIAEDYVADASTEFRSQCTTKKPQESYLIFHPKSPTTGPLEPYFRLSDVGKAKFCAHLALTAFEDEAWVYLHATNSDGYPKVSRESPSVFLLREHGILPTSQGAKMVERSFAPSMARWASWLPVADVSSAIAEKLKLRPDLDALLKRELEAMSGVLSAVSDIRLIAEYYAACARQGLRFPKIRCRRGAELVFEDATKVFVESDLKNLAILEKSGDVAFLAATPAEIATLRERWKLRKPNFTREISFEATGEATELVAQFPMLWAVPSDEIPQLLLQPCSGLGEKIIHSGGTKISPCDFMREGETIFHRDEMPRPELLRRVLDSLETPLDPQTRADLEAATERNNDEAREVEASVKVRRVKALPEKLLLCVGEKALKSRLPAGLLAVEKELKGDLSALQLAEMALAVYGVETLQEFRADLAAKGLQPPFQWAGSHSARRFVTDLGFPGEFAGFEGARRPRMEEVEGPPQLPKAHPYQAAMMVAIRGLATLDRKKRGLLALPTGAGKTRVAVEALVDAITDDGLAQGDKRGPILWIAQSDELCEQAVKTWKTLWRAKGTGARLMISRLWASNEADPLEDDFQIVVATIDKLEICIEKAEYDWLSRPCFVVIDEAHGATTPAYTRSLRWMGLSWGDQKQERDRCPLLGLTATAFRGNEEETKRLVARFGGYRLDFEEWGDDPYPALQAQGVLARVKQHELKGVELKVEAKDLVELRNFRRLSSKFEERLGANAKRNAAILSEVESLDATWPVLLFATSVSHAQTMAALLTLRGIPARAISGQTPPAARRHYIEEFRSGKIRVLTNFNVLTTGFDAPSVRCVLVARPIYSAGLYQQMIGRGLRGPANGGKEECLIINVADNITNFDGALAFRGFEYLWGEENKAVAPLPQVSAPEAAAPLKTQAEPEPIWFLNLQWDAVCPHQKRARQEIQQLVNEHPLGSALGYDIAKNHLLQYPSCSDKGQWCDQMVEEIENQVMTQAGEPDSWEFGR